MKKPLEVRGSDAEFLRAPRGRLVRPRGIVSVVDLFCGAGGLTLGVEEAARIHGHVIDVRLAAEADVRIASVYAKNFGLDPERVMADVAGCFDRAPGRALSKQEAAILEIVGPKLDMLVGGPPCQGHSTLNNHTRGDDPKNALYLTMVRAAELLRPRIVVIENVPAVERDRTGVVARAREFLERIGYGVSSSIVRVADIGVPQLRKRHVLVATTAGIPDVDAAIASAEHADQRTLEWAIRDLVGVRRTPNDEPSVLTKDNQKRARYLLRWKKYDLPNWLRPDCHQSDHKYKSMYGRLRWDAPAQTITTGFGSPGQGRYLHPEELRTLTPHEAARLQFFPDWFDFGTLHRGEIARMIGNAVPPKLGFVLASHFLRLAPAAKSSRRHGIPAARTTPPQLALFA